MLAAYATTDYRVEHPDGSFSLRVGSRCRRLDRLLTEHGRTTWAYLTAWNPFSILVPIEQNVARQRQLEAEVADRGWVTFTGHGHGRGDWPPEPSLLILGISEADALVLARVHRQAAIVVGVLGEAARLVQTCG